jgi:ABC-type branched-subunit amino acid transport system substrate-binding protein
MFCRSYILILVWCISIVACAPLSRNRAPLFIGNENSKRLDTFILWEPGQDIHGVALRSAEISKGDKLFQQGEADEALEYYQSAQAEVRDPAGVEALALRWAALLGYQNQHEEGLKLLSEYFKSQGIPANKVKGPSALMLGVLYAEKGDTDQALAWITASLERGALSERFASEAKQSLARVISRSTDKELTLFETRWKNKPVVVTLAKAELKSRRGSLPVASAFGGDVVNSGEPLSLVALLPLSGKYRLLGESTREGIDIAISHAAEKTPVKVHYIDTASGADMASTELSTLSIKERIDAVLGPIMDEKIILTTVRQLKIPTLHLSKREDADVGAGIFRLGITPSSQVKSLLEAAVQKGIKTVAVVYPSNELGYELGKTFQAQAVLSGISVKFGEVFKSDPKDLIDSAKRIEETGSDAVFFTGKLDEAAQLFAGFSESYRARVVPLGTAIWYNPERLKNLAKIMEGAIFVVPYFPGGSTEELKRFNVTFQDRYHREANFLSAQGFDAASLLIKGIIDSKNGGITVSQALSTVPDLRGLTGTLRPESSGEVDRTYTIIEYKDGTLFPVA